MCSQVITEKFPVINQVKSHLTWIDDILSELGTQEPNLSKVNYVHLVLRTYNSEYFKDEGADDGGVQIESEYGRNDSYDFEEDYNEESPKYANLFAKLVNKCAKIVFIGSTLDCVPVQLKELREIVQDLNGDHKRLEGAFEYCVDALEWSLKKLQCKELDGDVDDNDLQILHTKWKALQDNPKSLAAIAYLKATLRAEFKMEEIDVLYSKLLPQVIELDSEYHIWYHNLYNSTRNARKLVAFSEGGIMEAPSDKEINCCNRQLELSPHLLLSNIDMALLQKDLLWITVYKRQRHFANRVKDVDIDVDAVYQKCMQYLDIALKLAEENDLQKWILKIKYEKADVMIHVKDNEQIRNEGLRMLSELLKAFPGDAILHYKIGRLYLYGVYLDNIVLYLDASLSQKHFKTALKLKGYDFYPCIRDYMKSFKFSPDLLEVKELWTILDKCEQAFKRRSCSSLMYKVRICKAFVLWIYNPEDIPNNKRLATELWLDAFGQYQDEKMHRDNIFRPLNKPPFAKYRQEDGQIRKRNAEINLMELKNELISIMNDELSELKSCENVGVFVQELEKIQLVSSRFQKGPFIRSTSGRPAEQARNFRTARSTNPRKNTDADNDNDWRKK